MLPYVAAAPACDSVLSDSYMRDRLTEFLKGSGYVQQMLALEQQQMLAFGGGTISSYVDTESLASTYVLHSIFLWFGIVSGILVIVALASPCTAQSSLCPAPEQSSGSAGRHCCKWDSSF